MAMNTKKQTFKKSLIIISTIIALVVALAALELTGVIDLMPNSGPTPAQQAEQRKTEEQIKKDFIESSDPRSEEDKDDNTPITTPEVPTSPETVELSADKTSSSEVTVYTKLHGYSSGTCTLTAKNSDKEFTKTVPVIYQDNYSICAGFTVPVSQLGVGSWDIALSVTPRGGAPIAKNITYELKP